MRFQTMLRLYPLHVLAFDRQIISYENPWRVITHYCDTKSVCYMDAEHQNESVFMFAPNPNLPGARDIPACS
jgi:hypothetical protein